METTFNYARLLWLLYSIGLLFFSIRFIRNILKIHSTIKNNPKLKQGHFIHILLKEFVAPHTFFNNIFFHKKAYTAGNIHNEVIWHEETHAAQKHSLDILVIELLQVLFWFNPFLYLFKKSIKLNHEFLADREVIKRQQDVRSYQKILLNYAHTDTSPSMANAINYSSIKKRFKVMKTHTSKRATLIKVLLILPVLAILMYGFSDKKIVLKSAIEPTVTQKIMPIIIYIDQEKNIRIHQEITKLEEFTEKINSINQQLSEEQKKIYNYVDIRFEQEIDQIMVEILQKKLYPSNVRSSGRFCNNNALYSESPTLLKRTENGAFQVRDLNRTINTQKAINSVHNSNKSAKKPQAYAIEYMAGVERNGKRALYSK